MPNHLSYCRLPITTYAEPSDPSSGYQRGRSPQDWDLTAERDDQISLDVRHYFWQSQTVSSSTVPPRIHHRRSPSGNIENVEVWQVVELRLPAKARRTHELRLHSVAGTARLSHFIFWHNCRRYPDSPAICVRIVTLYLYVEQEIVCQKSDEAPCGSA